MQHFLLHTMKIFFEDHIFFAKLYSFFLHKSHHNIKNPTNTCTTQSKTYKLMFLFC
jgi:hypothetical protein